MKKALFWIALVSFFVVFSLMSPVPGCAGDQNMSLRSILPLVDGWEIAEEPEIFNPDNLYEYIDGAAELYLTYDFKELLVAQYKHKQGKANVSIEIYDMKTVENAFGIYGAERYPDNHFVTIGIQGYAEEDSLNFFSGHYYIKMICFDGGDEAGSYLKSLAGSVVSRMKDKGDFPQLVKVFPKEGLIPNSEKFSLRNFLGYSFLSHGYAAEYKLGTLAFDAFIIQAPDHAGAEEMVKKFLARKEGQPVEKTALGIVIKDKYYHNIYIAVVKNMICGVMKIKDGSETVGLDYLKRLAAALR